MASDQRPIEWTSDGARVTRGTIEDAPEVIRGRERFGGIDVPASVAGALVAIAAAVLIGGILGAAIGGFGYQWGVEVDGMERELSAGGLVAGVLVLFVAFVAGGWAAGRMARFDGPRNGLHGSRLGLTARGRARRPRGFVGSRYDVFAEVDLPQWFSGDALTAAALASGIASAVRGCSAACSVGISGSAITAAPMQRRCWPFAPAGSAASRPAASRSGAGMTVRRTPPR